MNNKIRTAEDLIKELKKNRSSVTSETKEEKCANLESIIGEQTLELQKANDKLTREIQERKLVEKDLLRNEERLEALVRFNEKSYISEDEIIRDSMEECVALTQSEVGYLHFFDENEEIIDLNVWSGKTILKCKSTDTSHCPIEMAGIWADSVRLRKPVIHNDYQNEPKKKGLPKGHFPIKRHMSVPVFDKETIVAIVGVGNKKILYTNSDSRQLSLFMKSMWQRVLNFRIEEKLSSESSLLNLILDNTPDQIYFKDRESRFKYVNGTLINRMKQRGVSEIIGKTDIDIFGEDIGGNFLEEERKVMEKGIPITENRVKEIWPDGSESWTSSSKAPATDENGQIRGLIGITRDITKRVEAEEALKLSENRFSSIIKDLSDIVIIMDDKARVSFFTPSLERILGYNIREIKLMKSALDIIHTDDMEGLKESLKNLIEGRIEHKLIEARCKHKNGKYLNVEFISANMTNHEGVNGFVITGRDVTERKRAESLIRKTVTELEASNQDLEQFAYAVSHDLQEPLRKVKSFAQLFEERYNNIDEKGSNYIKYMVEGTDRMQSLIYSLLDYSRITTRGKELIPTNLSVLVQEAVSNLEVAIKESKATVKIEELPEVMADGPQILRLIQNLLSNAIKFRGDNDPIITIKAREQNEMWTIIVTDNGIGIEEKFYERIFQIFQRLHSRYEYSGTGIGLSLCKRIVERHGGELWVKSQPGKGSDFCFSLKTTPSS